jgi:6,7-dimethyl-8-ribityllumazine synthase
VVSVYNGTITDELRRGAERAYVQRMGGKGAGAAGGAEVIPAAGAFELLVLCREAAVCGRFAGVVALGCIIKGETSHDQHLASAVTSGLAQLTIATGVPIGLGVLTVNTIRQARDRAAWVGASRSSKGNKGEEAMHALLDTLIQVSRLRTGSGGKNQTSRSAGGLALAQLIRARGTSAVPDKSRSARPRTPRR